MYLASDRLWTECELDRFRVISISSRLRPTKSIQSLAMPCLVTAVSHLTNCHLPNAITISRFQQPMQPKTTWVSHYSIFLWFQDNFSFHPIASEHSALWQTDCVISTDRHGNDQLCDWLFVIWVPVFLLLLSWDHLPRKMSTTAGIVLCCWWQLGFSL